MLPVTKTWSNWHRSRPVLSCPVILALLPGSQCQLQFHSALIAGGMTTTLNVGPTALFATDNNGMRDIRGAASGGAILRQVLPDAAQVHKIPTCLQLPAAGVVTV